MTHIEQRYGTAAEWTAANPVLNKGEVGWETDHPHPLSKLGDGVTLWNSLPYSGATVTVTKADVGLDQASNTNDLDKPISTATQSALNQKAPKDSPVFTGNPTAPTPDVADSDTSLATTGFVKAQFVSPVFTGTPTAPTPLPGDNDDSLATTAFVQAAIAAKARIVRVASAAQSVADATVTNMTIDSTENSVGTWATTATGITIPADGFYALSGMVSWVGSSNSSRRMLELLADAVILSRSEVIPAAVSGSIGQNVSALVFLTAGQIVTARLFQNSGASLSTSSTASIKSRLALIRLA